MQIHSLLFLKGTHAQRPQGKRLGCLIQLPPDAWTLQRHSCLWLAGCILLTHTGGRRFIMVQVSLFISKERCKKDIPHPKWKLCACGLPPHTLDLPLESAQNTTSRNLISDLQRVEDRPMSPEMGSRLGFTPLVALISCKEHAFICFCNYKGSSLFKNFFIMVNFI